jgi:hypothetical protein
MHVFYRITAQVMLHDTQCLDEISQSWEIVLGWVHEITPG